jgi:meso-butanediol dehydrogenase / (S,S)-butanediol dehydrogenase / diacetyl reductase
VSATKVLIVGANSPIAVAIAEVFRANGAAIAGVGLDSVNSDHYDAFSTADCSVPAEAERVVATADAELGGLDTVVLAAATMPVASAVDTTDAEWRSALSSTLDSAFYVARASLPRMAAGSSIVAVTSTNATLAAPGLPAYSAAKAGLEGLVRQLAFEYGRDGIRVNAVSPAAISTGQPAEGYPLRRLGKADEVAQAVFFLGSDAASFITGATLLVDGGLSISSPAAWLREDLRDRWL